jgi:NTP-dependent ternary system trypsin peptidase co-occuring protein
VAEFVRFELEDGTSVLVETAESDLVRQHASDQKPTEGGVLGDKLVGAAETAEVVSKTLRQRLSPDELTLELGLKVSGQANWFVAKAQTEGTIKVTLKWKHDTPPASSSGSNAQESEADSGGAESDGAGSGGVGSP